MSPAPGLQIIPEQNVKVYASFNGGTSQELKFTATPGTSTWVLAKAVFKIEGNLPATMDISIFAQSKSTKIDDFRLVTTTESGQTVNAGGGTPEQLRYAELPETLIPSEEFKYITYHAVTYSSRQHVRNYSACYDIRRHNPVWVAYPYHDIYEEGGWTRPSTDPWRPDPQMQEYEQSIIYPADWTGWPNHSDTRRWSKLDGMSGYLERGHLLASSNRGAGSFSVLLDMNVQTFYPTNISPERHMHPGHWTLVERILSDSWNCPDTVYVVAGCHYANDSHAVTDASWNGADGPDSKVCIVPTAHYKIFLRTKSGRSGKRVQDCSAGELMAIGFWFEQNLNDAQTADPQPLSAVTMSVAEIEQRTGNLFEFFPDIPETVKESYNVSDWPGLTEIINKSQE